MSIPCKKYADIAFLLDQSSSIGSSSNFRLETQFVKDVINKYSGGKLSGIRVGVIRYGETAELMIKLNEFSDFNSLKEAIDQRVTFKGASRTRIDLALEMANKQLFQVKNGDRPDASNILILVTDGQQNSGNWERDNKELVPRFAKPIWDRNITIAAIGVAQARIGQLQDIAGPTGNAIYRRRIKELNKVVDEILPLQCAGINNIEFNS